jgi:cell division protein FtsW (lipid II flippase)
MSNTTNKPSNYLKWKVFFLLMTAFILASLGGFYSLYDDRWWKWIIGVATGILGILLLIFWNEKDREILR